MCSYGYARGCSLQQCSDVWLVEREERKPRGEGEKGVPHLWSWQLTLEKIDGNALIDKRDSSTLRAARNSNDSAFRQHQFHIRLLRISFLLPEMVGKLLHVSPFFASPNETIFAAEGGEKNF